ncbi:serine--tRNA ligase [endosymbiont of Metamasius hemipterus]|uniref:Serine--tRNA ligase n=1 Tax=endosymbiont of Metamasius hemipterus TaxID=204627 RepID=A0ABT0TWC9_9GAMM|nr:serine--tRNA ligase [endosymbiont of Metamasius hemipterus]
MNKFINISNLLNNKIKKIKILFNNINNYINKIKYEIPNILNDEVPIGNKDKEIYKIKNNYKENFNYKSYLKLKNINNKINFNLSNKISNLKSVVFKNEIALMNRALINFMIDYHLNNKYEEIYVPLIVNEKCLYNTGQLPKFLNNLFFFNYKNKKNFLIPTSEVSIVNLFINTIIEKNTLPIKLVSYTPCFRLENGFYGKFKKGLIKLNHFDKVEVINIVDNNESDIYLENITNHVEGIINLLKLPYRKILLSSENTPFSSSKTYDIEIFFPYYKKYIEVSSCSNTKDFQSKRILLRYKDKFNNIIYPHILNASGLAIGRVLAAILENYQLQNGNIEVPKVLIPYMRNIKII